MKDYSKELTSEQKLVKVFIDTLNKRIEKLLIDNKKLKEQLTLTDVVDSKRFTETDLLNGYQAGCIEGLDECCDLGLDDLKEIKEDGEKWVKRYTE